MTAMDFPVVASSLQGNIINHTPALGGRSRSSTKLADDVTSLTSFNPFSEEDENDQSSYTLVTSIFSRVKSTLSAPLSSAVAAASGTAPAVISIANGTTHINDQRKPSYTPQQTQPSTFSTKSLAQERPFSLSPAPALVVPPLVSLTPAQPEVPTYSMDYDKSPTRSGTFYSPALDSADGTPFGTSIPGFPIPDDARSVKTSASFHRSGSVSKVIRRIRGEGKLIAECLPFTCEFSSS